MEHEATYGRRNCKYCNRRVDEKHLDFHEAICPKRSIAPLDRPESERLAEVEFRKNRRDGKLSVGGIEEVIPVIEEVIPVAEELVAEIESEEAVMRRRTRNRANKARKKAKKLRNAAAASSLNEVEEPAVLFDESQALVDVESVLDGPTFGDVFGVASAVSSLNEVKESDVFSKNEVEESAVLVGESSAVLFDESQASIDVESVLDGPAFGDSVGEVKESDVFSLNVVEESAVLVGESSAVLFDESQASVDVESVLNGPTFGCYEVKEFDVSSLNEVKEYAVSSLNDVKESAVSSLNEVKESDVSSLNEVKESAVLFGESSAVLFDKSIAEEVLNDAPAFTSVDFSAACCDVNGEALAGCSTCDGDGYGVDETNEEEQSADHHPDLVSESAESDDVDPNEEEQTSFRCFACFCILM